LWRHTFPPKILSRSFGAGKMPVGDAPGHAPEGLTVVHDVHVVVGDDVKEPENLIEYLAALSCDAHFAGDQLRRGTFSKFAHHLG